MAVPIKGKRNGMKTLNIFTLGLVIVSICMSLTHRAVAQTNSRGWVNIQQAMVGAQPSMTSTAFSAFNSVSPFKYFSIQGTKNVTTSAWAVALEGSNDKTVWTTIVSTSSGADPLGAIAFQPNAAPTLYLRVRATTLGSGQTITATAIGVP